MALFKAIGGPFCDDIGDRSQTCQPVQIAELAKKQNYHDLPNDAPKHLYWCCCFQLRQLFEVP
jgi:hypothetical protein